MKIIVNAHECTLSKELINEKEVNITKCEFEFCEEITDEFVKEAYFTLNGRTYKQIIVNNECDIPSEVLAKKGLVSVGVVAELVRNGEIVKRYNPTETVFSTLYGTLKTAQNSQPITPSEMEQYEQALQDGLAEVNGKLDDIDQALSDVNDEIEEVDDAIDRTNTLDLDVSKSGKTATVTLTKKDASTKTVTLSDGTSLMFNWDGTKLGIKTDEDEDYTYVDLQGIQGPIGPQGAPFTIKKTYSSVAEMNADFDNMQVGDYVMIASSVQVEDNAKLYTRGEEAWIFITDFSGATGIQGPTGLTPNIQIGTVVSGSAPAVTRTGTNEEPILNFTLQQGETGATGNGIASVAKTSTSGLVDTYTITYTSGNSSTFTVTNGKKGDTGNGISTIQKTSTAGQVDTYTITYTNGTTSTYNVTNGSVTQEQYDLLLNQIPSGNVENSSITLNDSSNLPIKNIEIEGQGGRQLLDKTNCVGRYQTSETVLSTGVRVTQTVEATTSYSGYRIGGSELLGKTITIYSAVTTSGTNKPAVRLFAGRSNKIYNTVIENWTGNSAGGKHTYTLPSTFAEGDDSFYILLYAHADNNVPLPAGTYADYTDLQVELGDTASPYEDYGASVTGNNTIYTNTKNWFNLQTCEKGFLSTNGGISGANQVTEYIVDDDSVTFTTNEINRGFVTDFIPVVFDKYKISFQKSNDNDIVGFIGYFDDKQNWIKRVNLSTAAYNIIPNNVKYIKINLQLIYAGSITLSNIQLECGTSATTYQRYDGASYPLNLGTTKLYSGDTIKKSSSDWIILRKDGTSTTISDTTLINQLNAIANMPTYKNVTNIEITASELKPILNLTYRKDLETLFNS